MKKSIYLVLVTSMLFSFSYSQNLNSENVKSILQSSTLAVFSAQKLLLSKDKKQTGGNLSKSVFYQLKAIELLKEKKLNEALCYSLSSRELSNDIIIKESGNLNPTYKLSDEELKTKSGCVSATDFFLLIKF